MAVDWNNLLPIRPGLTGDQYAGWEPDSVAENGLGCRLLADQWIPVAEGVRLSADVYLPVKEGRFPAIVQFAAYSKELHTAGAPTGNNEIGSPPVFTDRGYVQVVITRRGMGRSEGETGMFFSAEDVGDHERCIAWAAAQPWCDGQVALFGTSYYGMSQLLVAVRQPPTLKAFFCNEVCTDYFRQIAQFGGTFNVLFFSLWMGANFTDALHRLRVPPLVRAALSHLFNGPLRHIWQPILKRNTGAILRSFSKKAPGRREREWYAQWMADGRTRATLSLPEGPYRELGRIQVPFVVAQNLGYFNLHQFGCYDLFEHAGTPPEKRWMILGRPHYGLPSYGWQLEALAFFDHVLKGVENGYATQPRVRYWLDGPARYAGADGFPLPGARRCQVYLASGGADAEMHRLVETPPDPAGTQSWIAIPLGAPVVGGLDAVANQTLAYQLVAAERVRIAGPLTLRLRFSCNEIDSHLVARLGRIGSDGNYHLLSMGVLRPACRRVDVERSTACEVAIDTDGIEPLIPGVPVDVCFSLTPSACQLEKGEILRLEIASRTDLLRSDPSHGYVHFDLQIPPYFSRNTLHYGEGCSLEFDVVPSG